MSQPPIQAAKLAAQLAAGLAAVVPPELEVALAGTVVDIRPAGDTHWSMAAALRGAPGWAPRRSPLLEIDEISSTLEPILDQLQDEVAETLAEPWPAVAPGPMPMVFVELR